jgi:DNA-binding SARP family transcriptional activator
MLGAGRLEGDDGGVVLGDGLAVLILAYLYLQPGPVTRDHLAALFWPGRERPLALQSLRQILSRLRGLLGDSCLEATGRQVQVRRDLLASDLTDFQASLAQGDPASALELWGGGFLPESKLSGSWEVEDWLEGERARLQRMLESAVAEFALTEMGEGRSAEILPLLELAFRIFPFHEPFVELRFEASLRVGDVTSAAGALEDLRRLEPVGGVGPLEAKLQEALERLRTQRDARASESWAKEEEEEALHLEVLPSPTIASPRRTWHRTLLLLPALVLFASLLFARWFHAPGAAPTTVDEAHVVVYQAIPPSRLSEGFEASQIFRMNLDGRQKHRITDLERVDSFLWLEALDAILVRQLGEGVIALHLLRPVAGNAIASWSGAEVTALKGLENQRLFFGEVSPPPLGIEGRYAVVEAQEPGGTQSLYLLDPQADTVRRLTDDAGDDGGAVWIPATRELVFESNREGNLSLWALTLDPPEPVLRRLTRSPSQDRRVQPGPEETVVFVRGFGEGDVEGDMEILELDLRTGRETTLVSRPWNNLEPVWSPDFSHLCWKSEEFGHFESDLWILQRGTGRSWNVTLDLPGRNHLCTWAPDGRALIFARQNGPWSQVFRINLDGTELENLSRNDWSAVPRAILPSAVFEPRPMWTARDVDRKGLGG